MHTAQSVYTQRQNGIPTQMVQAMPGLGQTHFLQHLHSLRASLQLLFGSGNDKSITWYAA